MIIARVPRMLSRCFKGLTWNIPSEEKVVYLTFDDGPTPEITDWVLSQLEEYQAHATFFCLGKNVKEHPEIYNRIRKNQHAIGNHSNSHIKGFRTGVDEYLENIDRANELLTTELFRPPYGRIRPSQVKHVKKQYKIVMWDVLSVDYNRKLNAETVVNNVLKNVRNGSIVVFHDSLKASKNLYAALPVVLQQLSQDGYRFEAIKPGDIRN